MFNFETDLFFICIGDFNQYSHNFKIKIKNPAKAWTVSVDRIQTVIYA